MSVLSVVPPCVRIMYWNPANTSLEEDEKKINDMNVQLEMLLFVPVLQDLRLICVICWGIANSDFMLLKLEILLINSSKQVSEERIVNLEMTK